MRNNEWVALYPRQDTGLERELALEIDPYPDDFWIDFEPCFISYDEEFLPLQDNKGE